MCGRAAECRAAFLSIRLPAVFGGGKTIQVARAFEGSNLSLFGAGPGKSDFYNP